MSLFASCLFLLLRSTLLTLAQFALPWILADVFYTNSRYAKVGGLPQSELNQLELQFLLLNDFSLAIPLEEMQRYGDQLLLYSQNASTEVRFGVSSF